MAALAPMPVGQAALKAIIEEVAGPPRDDLIQHAVVREFGSVPMANALDWQPPAPDPDYDLLHRAEDADDPAAGVEQKIAADTGLDPSITTPDEHWSSREDK